MAAVLIDLEDGVLAKLNQLEPGPQDKRSAFIADAIRKAVWELEERRTAAMYAKQPDSATEEPFDPATWEQPEPRDLP